MKTFIIKRKDGGISIGCMTEDAKSLDDEVAKWQQSSGHESSYHRFEDRFPDDPERLFDYAYDHNDEVGVFIDEKKVKQHEKEQS